MKMYNFLVLTNKGVEDITKIEIKEVLGKESIVNEHFVEFNSNYKDAYKLAYLSQSSRWVLRTISIFEFDNLNDIKNSADIIKIPNDITNLNFNTFAVKAIRVGEHKFNSLDIEKIFGAKIKNELNKELNLKNPDALFRAFIFDNKLIFGLDIAGFDLSKRTYNLFKNSVSIRSILNYAMVRLSEYKPGEVLLDPYMRSGEIVIESVLYATSKSSWYFDKERFKTLIDIDLGQFDKLRDFSGKIYGFSDILRSLKQAKMNAQAIQIHKLINFSKTEIDWLDVKLEDKSIDRIVSFIPQESKGKDINKLKKTYTRLLENINIVLKDNGKAVLGLFKDEVFNQVLERFDFEFYIKNIYQNKSLLRVYVINKKTNVSS
jgi:23S rRNA G2445 N2-methylase RlmL